MDEAGSLADRLPSTFDQRDADLALCHDVRARRHLLQSQYKTALEEEEQAISLRRRLPAPDLAARIQIEGDLITSLNGARRAAGQLGRWAEAVGYSREAVQLAQQHRADGHEVDIKGLACNLAHLSEAYLFVDRQEDALRASEEGVRIVREYLPHDAGMFSRVLVSHAVVVAQLGRPEAAVADMDEAILKLAISREPRGFDVALAHVNRAEHLRTLERYAEARDDAERAVEVYKAWYGEVRNAALAGGLV